MFSPHKTKKHQFKKKQRINPRHAWFIVCVGFAVILVLQVLYHVWFFTKVVKEFDEPAIPELQTNAAKIEVIDKSLDKIERAVKERTEITGSVQ